MPAVPNEADYLMISGLQHYIFCPRQWALIHIEQVWAENYFTAMGEAVHERVDDATFKEKRGERIYLRAVPVVSHRLNMTGRCDLIEGIADPAGVYLPRYKGTYRLHPVEYKFGRSKFEPSDRYQLLAQIMALEEMLATDITFGELFYFRTRRREAITFTDDDKTELIGIAKEMHRLYQKGHTPKSKLKKACRGCSLANLCLPTLDKVPAASEYLEERIRECENY